LPPLRSGPDGQSTWFDWLTNPLPKRFMLPATGLLIMGLDWLLFSEEAASLGLLIPFTAPIGFLAASIGAYHLQTKHGLDAKLVAALKGLLAGILVAIPFPLAGTLVGGAILTSSGLAGLRWRLLKSRFSR
jgi:Flp pilus assembly protein protease CpaA